MGTLLSDCMRNIHQLLPYTIRSKKNTPDPCEYVQLYSAYCGNRNQYNHWNGDIYMAEGISGYNGLYWSNNSESE